MSKPRIVFRADGNSKIGLGHLIRTLALADSLKNDFYLCFVIQNPNKFVQNQILEICDEIKIIPDNINYHDDVKNLLSLLNVDDIIVLDGYNFKTEYQITIKRNGNKLVYIDDIFSFHIVADAVINHANGVKAEKYKIEKYTKLYLGSEYALLRKPFLEGAKQQREITNPDSVFISMGGADVKNITYKIIKSIIDISEIKKINILISTINPNRENLFNYIHTLNNHEFKFYENISADDLYKLIKSSDIAICPASSISLECCSVGIGLVTGYTEDNQKNNLEGYENKEVAVNLGNLNNISEKEINNQLRNLLLNTNNINKQIKNQKTLIDGKSPERFVEIFKNL